MSKIKEYTNTYVQELRNGCHVVYEQMKNTNNTSTIIICCKVGSINENSSTEGFAHLIEHILFTSDTGNENYSHIFERFDLMGIEFNASSTKTCTTFVISCLTTHLFKMISILGNIIFNSNIITRDIQKEQHVIENEIALENNDSRVMAYREFDSRIYNNTPYVENMGSSITRQVNIEELKTFYQTFFVPNNMDVSIVSSISPDSLFEYIANSIFGKISRNPKLPSLKTRTSSRNIETGLYVRETNCKTTTVMFGFPIFLKNAKERSVFTFLQYHLNKVNGILFRYIRMQKGIAYNFYSDFVYEDIGSYFGIVVETISVHVNTVIQFCNSLYSDLQTILISENEMDSTKQSLQNNILLKYTAKHVCEYNLKQLQEKPFVPYKDMYAKHYETLSNRQIKKACKLYFIPSTRVISVIGKNLPPLHQL